jgi:hypothetical protein
MLDKLIEQYFEMLANSRNTTRPEIFIYRYSVDSDGNITELTSKTPYSKSVKSEKTLSLEKTIKEKRKEMELLAQKEKFEEAISARQEINELQLELNESNRKDLEDYEKNKTAKELLQDLKKQLEKAVKDEDYETAATIRDKIKSISEQPK